MITQGQITIYDVFDGNEGPPGPIGPPGVGVASVEEYYLATSAATGVTTATAGFSTTMKTMTTTNKYLWNYEKINFTNGTSQNTAPVIIGVYGNTGGAGATGRSIVSIVERYLASPSVSGVTRDTIGWNTAVQVTSPTNKYLWNYEEITWSSAPLTTYVEPVIIGVHGEKGEIGSPGSKGDPGADGRGIVSALVDYQLDTDGSSAPTGTWTAALPIPIAGTYLWTRTTTKYTDNTSVITYSVSYFATNGQQGTPGTPGNGISSTTVHYQLHTNGTTAPIGTWATTLPTPVKGQFLWTRTTVNYTNGTNSVSYSTSYYATDGQKGDPGDKGDPGQKGDPGAAGVGISTTAVTYQLDTDGTTAPTGTWSSTIPTPIQGRYLWTKTVTTYTNATTSTTYSVSYLATDGQKGDPGSVGNGVSTTTIHYQLHTNGTTAPTGTWSTSPPTPIQGRYLWTRTVITYTNGTSATLYSTAYHANDGGKGDKGDPGNPGKGVVSSEVAYQLDTDGTSAPTSTWTPTIPTPIKGRYLWTRTVTTYTDGSSVITYSVSYLATDGDKGDTGNPGVGISSSAVTYNLHTNGSTAPTDAWTTAIPTPIKGQYLWTKTVTTYTDGTSSTAYSTSYYPLDGQKGDPGTPGKGVSSIVEQYYLSTSSTTQAGGTWGTTVPAWIDGRFYWTRSVITYTDGTSTTTNPLNVTGAKGGTGGTGTPGVSITKVDVMYYLSTLATSLSGGTWATTAPAWVNGRFMWSKTVVTFSNGTVTESTPANITGATGGTGPIGTPGRSVTSTTTQWYLSTSSTALSGGTWAATPPAYINGRFMWERTVTNYANPTGVDYGAGVLSPAWAGIISAQTTADGKNDIFTQDAAPPTTGRKLGDIWFDTNDGNKMYRYNAGWVAAQFGENAIVANSITANHIKSLAGLNVNDQFKVDANGNVTFAGALNGASGTFTGEVVVGDGNATIRLVNGKLFLFTIYNGIEGSREIEMSSAGLRFSNSFDNGYTEYTSIFRQNQKIFTLDYYMDLIPYESGVPRPNVDDAVFKVVMKTVDIRDLLVGGTLDSTGLLSAKGGLAVTGTATVSGAVTLSSTLRVNGQITANTFRATASSTAITMSTLAYLHLSVSAGEALRLTFPSGTNGYMTFYDNATRVGYIGYGGSGSDIMTFNNTRGNGRYQFQGSKLNIEFDTVESYNHVRILAGNGLFKFLNTGSVVQFRSRDDVNYAEIHASKFTVGSSPSFKKNMKPVERSFLREFLKYQVQEYNLNTDVEGDKKSIGLRADNVPPEISAFGGDMVDLYGQISYLWRVVGELIMLLVSQNTIKQKDF